MVRTEVLNLYDSVGWATYTVDDGDALLRGLAGSHLVLTAREDSGALIGLARTVSDAATVCYVQDLLVRPQQQRRGVGSALIRELQGRYAHCRYFLLSTDHESAPAGAGSHPFYRAMGLVPHAEQGMTAFMMPLGPSATRPQS